MKQRLIFCNEMHLHCITLKNVKVDSDQGVYVCLCFPLGHFLAAIFLSSSVDLINHSLIALMAKSSPFEINPALVLCAEEH